MQYVIGVPDNDLLAHPDGQDVGNELQVALVELHRHQWLIWRLASVKGDDRPFEPSGWAHDQASRVGAGVVIMVHCGAGVIALARFFALSFTRVLVPHRDNAPPVHEAADCPELAGLQLAVDWTAIRSGCFLTTSYRHQNGRDCSETKDQESKS